MAPCDQMDSCVSNPTSPAKLVSSEEGVVSGVTSEKLQKEQSPDIKLGPSGSNEELITLSIIPLKTPQAPDVALQSDNRHFSSAKPEKVSKTSNSSVVALLPSHEITVADGFVVSLEEDISADPSAAPASDKHKHRGYKIPYQVAALIVPACDDVKSEMHSSNRKGDKADNNDVPDSKRQKKDSPDINPVRNPTGEQRLVVKTMSEVDVVDDGYRWRKYGHRLVKRNLYLRSYYRCSMPCCPVKKHVERAYHDPKMTMTCLLVTKWCIP